MTYRSQLFFFFSATPADSLALQREILDFRDPGKNNTARGTRILPAPRIDVDGYSDVGIGAASREAGEPQHVHFRSRIRSRAFACG